MFGLFHETSNEQKLCPAVAKCGALILDVGNKKKFGSTIDLSSKVDTDGESDSVGSGSTEAIDKSDDSNDRKNENATASKPGSRIDPPSVWNVTFDQIYATILDNEELRDYFEQTFELDLLSAKSRTGQLTEVTTANPSAIA